MSEHFRHSSSHPSIHPTVEGMTASAPLDRLNEHGGLLSNYYPDDRVVVLFIQRGGTGYSGDLLLIEKKRGFGQGKINGPGGKLEKGESFLQAAIRECNEEVGLTPHSPEFRGRLYCSFKNGYSFYGEVFWAYQFSGNMGETEEARPFWCPVRDIPYKKMWSDDRLWLPHAISGQHFSASFFMDDDVLIHSQVHCTFAH